MIASNFKVGWLQRVGEEYDKVGEDCNDFDHFLFLFFDHFLFLIKVAEYDNNGDFDHFLFLFFHDYFTCNDP